MSFVAPLICLLVFLLVAGSVIRSPRIPIPKDLHFIDIDFSIAPILGVFILLSTHTIAPLDVWNGIIGNEFIKPWQIIILFFSLAYICVSMDSSGIYNYLALKAVMTSNGSGLKVFFAFFVLSSTLTLFTSNDIVVLTLTPLIAYFTQYTKTNPLPYLFVQFFASNIWSIALYIGNPTNIIVGEAFRIPFVIYSGWMMLPAIGSGCTSLLLVYFVFKSSIPHSMNMPQIDPSSVLKSRGSAAYGLCCLFGCLILLSLSSWLHVPIWIITLSFAILMIIKDVFNDFRSIPRSGHVLLVNSHTEEGEEEQFVNQPGEDHELESKDENDNPNSSPAFNENQQKPQGWRGGDTVSTIKKLPWKIVPFVVGMFIMVEGLNSTGLISVFAKGLSYIVGGPTLAVFVVCYLSAMVCNVLNNQPMTILFTRILLHSSFAGAVTPLVHKASMYALIMGSNFGANFTLIGALAGIMWSSILSDKGIEVSYLTFAKYGFVVMPVVVAVACSIFAIELAFVG